MKIFAGNGKIRQASTLLTDPCGRRAVAWSHQNGDLAAGDKPGDQQGQSGE
ncbi:MAG TPA: hypothetical protein VN754_00320 [Candidatus Binataceae bacterium]|nr:hypothetical protein [Candidatus Binataceae bacterium]